MEKLDQEKFDTLKELADLQTNISFGRAELKKLQEDTAKYMVIREEKAEARVLKVLKESRNALEETTDNHKELKSYNSELQAYANELSVLAKDITTLFKGFEEKMDKANNDIETHYKKISEVEKQAKAQRIQLKEDRKQLERERLETNEQTKLLVDKREALDRAWKELKKKNG